MNAGPLRSIIVVFATAVVSPALRAIWSAIVFDYWTRVLAGLTVYFSVSGVVGTFRFLFKKYHRRQSRKVFGSKTESCNLAYAALEVHPAVVSTLQAINPQLAEFPLAKPAKSQMAFNAQKIVSSCELRAVGYLEAALSRDLGLKAQTVADDAIVQRLDLDFISLGATSNLKTNDIFGNAANSLADYDPDQGNFIFKTNSQPIFVPSPGHDYGIILRVHPSQFPHRTWIACAGLGEWGTSGTAWFLANKWRAIAKKVQEDQPFLCVIEVQSGQDESASLSNLIT